MSSHDSHGLSPREPKLGLEEVEGVVSGPLWVWLGLGLGSSVGHWVTGHTVTPPVLELNLSREAHLGNTGCPTKNTHVGSRVSLGP